MPNCQSYGRTPQPWSTSGFTTVGLNGFPKVEVSQAPQLSTLPVVVGDCAPELRRSQSTTKSLSLSCQERSVVCENVTAGFAMVYCASLLAACRYLLTFTLSDVLPLPKTSYAAPMRGVMSW